MLRPHWLRQVTVIMTIVLPWRLRRLLLEVLLGYRLHPTSRIGLAFVAPVHLEMGAHSSIGRFTVCKAIELLRLDEHASIGRGNWITGTPVGDTTHYTGDSERQPALVVGRHAAITHRHIIDCTAPIAIGDFTIVAGFRSQLLTHSVEVATARQKWAPIDIGSYCFVGTGVTMLGGSALPSYSVLGASSLLNRVLEEQYGLYGGVPARFIKTLPPNDAFFTREVGFIA